MHVDELIELLKALPEEYREAKITFHKLDVGIGWREQNTMDIEPTENGISFYMYNYNQLDEHYKKITKEY